MFKFIKNKFLFIILISIATLAVLVIGAVSLYRDNSLVFADDGYIIETSTKTNTKYYFTANTKYKENVEEKITFSDKDSNKVSVEPASFVHYNNGNVSFLKKGALVNLADITSPMVSYYNITNENTIVYEEQHYTVTSNDKKISIESFIGRISDNKYLIAGKDLSLKIPTEEKVIEGEYFEILFIEEGIVKIDNQEHSYQVTAQDSYLYIGDNIAISLGDGKISYDGDVKMLLSQITINGDENIDLDVENETTSGGSGDGSGSGTGEGSGEDGDGTGEGDGIEGEGEGTGEGTGEGDGTGNGTGTGTGSGNGNGESGDKTTASPQIELIEAIVTSTEIDLTMQLNNANLAKGNVVAYLTNVSTGNKETPKRIDLVNGTFKLPYSALMPGTEYALTIVETEIANEKQYFQKTFRTKELGITLEKTYATDNSLSYSIKFDENTDVNKVNISIYDNNGSNTSINPNQFTVSRDDLNNTVTFTGLKSNTSYSVNVDTVWIDNIAYSNLYTINRIDTTLKQTPTIFDVDVETNAEEFKFTIELKNVQDKDKSIISYTYNIYLADDITLENTNPEVQYSVTKNDSDPLVLNLLNEISELKTGVDYRCKITAQYYDNEMIREVSTDYSSNFLIKSKPKISFELTNADMSTVTGTITLIDANCTVPMNGRTCAPSSNKFTLRYYELEKDETTAKNPEITFDSKTLTSKLELKELKSNTKYAVKVFGSYYDDNNVLRPGVQIGDVFYVETDESPEMQFVVVGDNKSGEANPADVVTFQARLTKPQNVDLETLIEEDIKSVTLNLYNGRYNAKDKLIGTYTITDKAKLEDFFNNITITNSLFKDADEHNINTLEKLINLTGTKGTLNNAYTVEVEGLYNNDEAIKIENNIYTFNITPSYYLDSRIATSNSKYVIVDTITKDELWGSNKEEPSIEYQELKNKIKKINLDDLEGTTAVGITIGNSLSDDFVNSAFTYKKVVVDYIICNETLKSCKSIIDNIVNITNELNSSELAPEKKEELTTNLAEEKEKVKIISDDMGNKYQPKEQTVYLDEDYFVRGYRYTIGYILNFTIEDEPSVTYKNDALFIGEQENDTDYKILKQAPIYTQYISTSNDNSITYRYSITDIDNDIADKNFYYALGEDIKNVKDSVKKISGNNIVTDGKYHDITIPINENNTYTLYYASKNTKSETQYNAIATNEFEKEYVYDKENSYTLIKNINDNTLKIKLENNDVTNRAFAYKVTISADGVTDYTRYFLTSKLDTKSEETNELNEKGEPITISYKYIAIDYANISKFIGKNMKVTVSSYYDSGLMGYNQPFNNGLILKNKEGKYLNIYNTESNVASTHNSDSNNMGIYFLREPYTQDGETIYLYNKLKFAKDSYNKFTGATWLESATNEIGVQFNAIPTNKGMKLNKGATNYEEYDAKVLNEANLNTADNNYKFDAIIPTIDVTANKTINSIKVNITPSGVYGDNQFTKNGATHNKVYVQLCKDVECKDEVKTISASINISGNKNNGYSAEITDDIEFTDLDTLTTYYIKVWAYVDNNYTQLYDSKTKTDKSIYSAKTYETSTLAAKDILDKIEFEVKPIAYSEEPTYEEENGTKRTTSTKQLKWKLRLENTKNYKIRFELYEPNGTTTTIDPDTGEEIITTNFKPVQFNGTANDSCNINENGNSTNGYIKNCYISVAKDDVGKIHDTYQYYNFTGDDFVFGGNYYKLLIYAIPYTNNKYVEEQKVLIYQNDSLTTISNNLANYSQNIKIDPLEEPSASLKDVVSGSNDTDGNYISFYPSIDDTTTSTNDKKSNSYVMLDQGSYTVRLLDESMSLIEKEAGCKYYIGSELKTSNNCEFTMNSKSVNQIIKFIGLDNNAPYYIQIVYDIYRNNNGLDEKKSTISFTDFIYTPVDNGVALGSITAVQSSNKEVILNYNGASNLTLIKKIEYKISLIGGSGGSTGGEYTEFVSNGTTKLIIDTSDSAHSSNTGFTLKTGNTYIITTKYYLDENTVIKDSSGKDSFTTLLKL